MAEGNEKVLSRGFVYLRNCVYSPILIYFSTGLYHYGGSLTTPNCEEYVQWLVFDKPLKIRRNGLVSNSYKNCSILASLFNLFSSMH